MASGEEDGTKGQGNERTGVFAGARAGQMLNVQTLCFDNGGKKEEKKEVHKRAEHTFSTYSGPPPPAAYAYPPRQPPAGWWDRYLPPQPQPTEWDHEAYNYHPRNQPQRPTEWDDGANNDLPRKPPRGYGAMDWDGGVQEKPPTQQGPPHEVNEKPAQCKPLEQEPPNEKKETVDMPSLPKTGAAPPRKQPQPHPGWAGYPPQHGEGGYYGGYPPAQRRDYPPSRPSLPPPYQGGRQWDGYDVYARAYTGWPKPAPPARAYPTYEAYHNHHGGYGGDGRYGRGKYAMGHQGNFMHYVHHQGEF